MYLHFHKYLPMQRDLRNLRKHACIQLSKELTVWSSVNERALTDWKLGHNRNGRNRRVHHKQWKHKKAKSTVGCYSGCFSFFLTLHFTSAFCITLLFSMATCLWQWPPVMGSSYKVSTRSQRWLQLLISQRSNVLTAFSRSPQGLMKVCYRDGGANVHALHVYGY